MTTLTKSPRINRRRVRRAVKLLGGLSRTGQHFGITPQAVYKWIVAGRVPANRCAAVEALLNGRVTRRDLNPRAFAE